PTITFFRLAPALGIFGRCDLRPCTGRGGTQSGWPCNASHVGLERHLAASPRNVLELEKDACGVMKGMKWQLLLGVDSNKCNRLLAIRSRVEPAPDVPSGDHFHLDRN